MTTLANWISGIDCKPNYGNFNDKSSRFGIILSDKNMEPAVFEDSKAIINADQIA